jgi:hypothetical protein
MDITSETEMNEHVATLNYLVVFPDRTYHFFRSLREIEEAICVDASTISKRLKNARACICTAKGSGYVFWINRL